MSTSRIRPVALATAGLLTALAAASGPAADAKPPVRPGRVSQLAVTGVSKPAAAYRIATSWGTATAATSYRVAATDPSGAVLDKATVTTPTWTAVVTASAGTDVRLTVTPYRDARKGSASRIDTVLPDLTAPTGQFQVSRTGQVATVAQTALADDVSQPGQISRSVDWGDGTAGQPWGSGATLQHTYAGSGLWHPTVTLTDAAGNKATVPAGVVVIGDEKAPTGSFAASPVTGWARFTEVSLAQLTLQDDFSRADDVQRSVDWGDGTRAPWPLGTTPTHVYAGAGSFTPRVSLLDEAGNQSVVAADAVTVAEDSAAPVVRLRVPAHHRTSLRAWRALAGRATDAASGLAAVRVKVIEKRATGWFAYRPASRSWVRVRPRARPGAGPGCPRPCPRRPAGG